MLLINKHINSTKNDAQSALFTEIKQAVESTLTQLRDIYVDKDINKHSRYIDVTDVFETNYKSLNPRFRKLFFPGTSENNTSVNLYTKSHNKKNYIEVVKTAHPEFEFKEENRYFTKFEYNIDVLWTLYKENLTVLYAKHGNQVHFLQIIVSYLKVVIDNFSINKVKWDEIYDGLKYVLHSFDDVEVRMNVSTYGEKPARQRKSGITYNSKTKSMDLEVRSMLDSGMKKKDIAEKLKISRMTLDRMIKNNPFLQ